MRLVEFPTENGVVVYVNPETVRIVREGHPGAWLHFDDVHKVAVVESAPDVVKKLVGGSLE
jgi:hypothetical protein